MEPLWAELINSDWHDYLGHGHDEDRLASPAWLVEFLSKWDVPLHQVASRATRLRLRKLRGLLSRLALELYGGKALSAADLGELNGFLDRDSVVRQVQRHRDGYSLHHTAVKGGLNAVLSEIAASFADMLANGDPTRIRVCENPDCRWFIYDRSKNRSRRWCEGPTGCGNLIKVRRHRERRRTEAAAATTTAVRRDRTQGVR